MMRLLQCGTSVLFGTLVLVGLSEKAWSLDLKDIEGAWADQLSKAVINPPERGQVLLPAAKGTSGNFTPGPTFNRYLSLLITDVDTVSAISFSAVMDQLASQSGDPKFSKEMLFHQWWDTQNQQPGLDLGPHCDETPPQDKLKHFSYDCPRLEGNQATDAKVFTDESAAAGSNLHAYSAIAFSNRYDLLTPPQSVEGGKVKYPDCGEYRIIFALNTGKTTPPAIASDGKLHEGDIFNRNLISFEFRVKNPDPRAESANVVVPAGCVPILKFWYSLSDNTTGRTRGQRLLDFFMNGKMTTPGGQLIGQLPTKVVDIHNLSFGSGQIRTNQFLNNVTVRPPVPPHDYTPGTPGSITVTPNNWVLREFRTLIVGTRLLIVPDTTKSDPDLTLFAKSVAPGTPADPRLAFLIANIKDQAENLLGGERFKNVADINAIKFLLTKSVTNAEQSVAGSPVPCGAPSTCNPSPLNNIVSASTGNINLDTDIQDILSAIKAPQAMTANNVIDRLRTQTCAGCHQFSDTKQGAVGFDDKDGLGGGAHWPTKACGDYAPSCSIPSFLISDKNKLHPPMQFTQVSEAVLTPAVGDGDGHWRYAISSTVECMLDFREKFMKAAIGMPATSANSCPP